MRSFSTVSVDQMTLLWSFTCLYGRRALEHSQQAMPPINRQRGIYIYGLLCMAASGWIDIIHYTYIHTYKHTYKDNTTIYTMQ